MQKKKKSEIGFFVIWILNPIAILLYQNCTPANLATNQPKITPVIEKSTGNLNLQR